MVLVSKIAWLLLFPAFESSTARSASLWTSDGRDAALHAVTKKAIRSHACCVNWWRFIVRNLESRTGRAWGGVTKRKRKVCVWDKLKERSCKHCCDGEGNNYKCAHCLAKTKKGMEEYIYTVAATGRVQPRFIVCVQHVKGMQPPNHAWPSYASRSFQAK